MGGGGTSGRRLTVQVANTLQRKKTAGQITGAQATAGLRRAGGRSNADKRAFVATNRVTLGRGRTASSKAGLGRRR